MTLRYSPADVVVINTAKDSPVQPAFKSFNVAPRDLPEYARADYRNGCWIIEKCGFGLGPSGYYPCAIAAGIDRILGSDLGRLSLPSDEDDMSDLLDHFCRMCGHFKQHRERGVDGVVQSESWREAYRRWHALRPTLTKY